MNLTAEQHAAATAPEQHVRVLSGAGTGKTTTLGARVRYLVEECDVPQSRILALTFSRRAARQLGEKIGYAGVKVLTIHALCYRLIQRFRPVQDIVSGWRQRAIVAKALRALYSKETVADVLREIHWCKARAASPRRFAAEIAAYQQQLAIDRVADYDDLILISARGLWDLDPDSTKLAELRQYEHILLDEGQDTSEPQWNVILGLKGPAGHLWACGDWQQSMYGFRGAKPDVFLSGLDRALADNPPVNYPLTHNFRSTPPILAVANRIMQGEAGALELRPGRDFPTWTPEPELVGFTDEEDEARGVVAEIEIEMNQDRAPHDIAILARTNAALEPFQRRLAAAGIPSFVVGGRGFYDRTEIIDIVSYLRLSQGWRQEDIERIYSRPTRYLGKAWLGEVGARGGWDWFARCREADLRSGWSKGYMGDRAVELRRHIETLQGLARMTQVRPMDVVMRAILKTPIGYQAWAAKEETDDVDEMVGENLERLIQTTANWKGSIAEFLVFIAQLMGGNSGKHDDLLSRVAGKVQLSTCHQAKGLEWPVVFGVGLSEKLLPHWKAVREGEEAEEKRIFYVMATRAKERLVLTGIKPMSKFAGMVKGVLHGPRRSVAIGEAAAGTPAAGRDSGGRLHGEDRPGDRADHAAEGDHRPVVGGAQPGADADGVGSSGRAAEGDVPGVPVDVAPDPGDA